MSTGRDYTAWPRSLSENLNVLCIAAMCVGEFSPTHRQRYQVLLLLLCLFPFLGHGTELYCSPHDVSVQVGGEVDIMLTLSASEGKVEIFPCYEPPNAADKITKLGNITIDSVREAVNFSVAIHAVRGGHVTVFWNASKSGIEDNKAYTRVSIIHSNEVLLVCIVVGWIYFVAWSVSFYPQVYENFKRKCVVGLNLDFVALNVLGNSVYGLFNIGIYWIPSVQLQYFELHPMGVIPVQTNDVVFSIHATILSIFTAYQCTIYERGTQKVWSYTWVFIGASTAFIIATTVAAALQGLTWLTLLYCCSYVKLAVTLIKYIPQAYLNYSRQSTDGFSIGGVLLDMTGGFLSILQMFLLAYNNDDWDSIFGDPTKFGLGLFSVLFDLLFMVQHFVLYRNNDPQVLLNDGDDFTDEYVPSVMA